MSTPNHHIQTIGDYVASFTASLVVVSQWSQVLTPIATSGSAVTRTQDPSASDNSTFEWIASI